MERQGPFNTYRYLESKDTTVKKGDVNKVDQINKYRVQKFQK